MNGDCDNWTNAVNFVQDDGITQPLSKRMKEKIKQAVFNSLQHSSYCM